MHFIFFEQCAHFIFAMNMRNNYNLELSVPLKAKFPRQDVNPQPVHVSVDLDSDLRIVDSDPDFGHGCH